MIFTASFVCHAGQVYKWVDENGNTQFSQFPPSKDQQSEQLNVKTQKSNDAAKQRLKDSRQKLLENSVGRNTVDKEDEEKAERMAENCKKAKQQMRNVQNIGRMYRVLENGERHWYNEKEIQQKKDSAKQQVAKYCK